ncbi:MAG: aminotransferase class III-fold pyridoxal phosphate-dependent enzyme, partial [Rhodospirillales bacterium]|nr:aminotransferase class III-fold pyridoxal phosphate-dependent enzyme [Rhodospirillales bacterium]
YVPSYQVAHPKAFELANRLLEILPQGGQKERQNSAFTNVFFANSGSEAVESALKIAMAYHYSKGEGRRTRLIGRARGFHGSGFAGTSVGGVAANRKQFGNMLPEVDHLPHTLNIAEAAFSKGQPVWGAHLADELENIIQLHGAHTIAAVIIEPMSGAGGVIPPPQGYLKKLRDICTRHGVLLIFDEVITAFGRAGAATASEKLGIQPDLICLAKGLTNGTVPMGAVAISAEVYKALMTGPENAIEFFHGYTYSGHPVASAAGLAVLDIAKNEGLFDRAAELAPYFEEAVHSLKGVPNVIDIRNFGLAAGVELESRGGVPGTRGFDVFRGCFEHGILSRVTGDILALAPAMIAEKTHIDQLVETLGRVIRITD